MNPAPEEEVSATRSTPVPELGDCPAEVNVFALSLKIESRLRKETRDDLRAQKGVQYSMRS
jgi:hypothetical protein